MEEVEDFEEVEAVEVEEVEVEEVEIEEVEVQVQEVEEVEEVKVVEVVEEDIAAGESPAARPSRIASSTSLPKRRCGRGRIAGGTSLRPTRTSAAQGARPRRGRAPLRREDCPQHVPPRTNEAAAGTPPPER